MDTYSVAEAKNRLPNLIDQALEGETAIITRHGKPVVELTRTGATCPRPSKATYEWLRDRRRSWKTIPITTEELLRKMAERDPE
jgi:antitoxin (DNA-binding transcriptional repressor) of toxin-antitoxin stability system